MQSGRGLIIAHRSGLAPQGFDRDVGTQVAALWAQAGEFFQRRLHQALRITFDNLTLVVGTVLGKQAGPVQVQIGIQVVPAELVDLGGKTLRNVVVAQELAYDRAVLGLDQGVVVRAPGPRLGELGVQLVQHLGHSAIDVFAAVIGMHTQDGEGESIQHFG